METLIAPPCPDRDCPACPRLVAYRLQNRTAFPDKFNAPVPPFGPLDAPVLIAGLAPGLKGANFSGRPFTGDFAGDLLYATLLDFGLAKGEYKARPDDGMELTQCRIVNAVRCVPPQNKPEPQEIKNCAPFLAGEIGAMKNLKVILAQGKIAHDAVVRNFGLKLSAHKFAHGAHHAVADGITLIDTYHCSRYNTNTGRLTEKMFRDIVADVKKTALL